MTVRVAHDFTGVGQLLRDLVAGGTLPGASVLVRRDGAEAYYAEAGFQDVERREPVKRDTIFRIYSMTKPVTAAAVMVLCDAGKVALDDPVARHVPELASLSVLVRREGDRTVTTPARQATVRDLLTHTAGYSYWFQPGSPVADLYDAELGAGRFERWRFDPALGGLDGLAKHLARIPLVSQPGERWHYSMSLEVAGLVVERASGQRLDAFMRSRLFEPLGMRDTGFSVPSVKASRVASLYGPSGAGQLELVERGRDSVLLGPVPGLSGGGGLMSTIDDYARFADLLLNGGGGVLSRASVTAMMTEQLRPDQLAELPELAAFGLGGSGDGLGFGLGGAVVRAPSASGVPTVEGEYSWGGAASTTFWVDPRNRLSVVFMTQVVPPSPAMLWDKLHAAIYAA
jgi:CubicO group peptidase (beta-lactamase class C family)